MEPRGGLGNPLEGSRVLGGTGPPRFCRQLGGGIVGRAMLAWPWPHHARSYADGVSVGMAKEEDARTHLAKVGSLAARRAAPWLEAQDLGEAGLLDVAPGQPLHLRLLRAMLEAAGDPD